MMFNCAGRQLCLLASAGLWAATTSFALPEAAQALLDRARAANPSRYQFAIDWGVEIVATGDGRSFYLLWLPAGAERSSTPLIATIHGSESWAFDEFFLWHEAAHAAGYGIVALQWWFGGDAPQSYYDPEALHRELRAALRAHGAGEGTVLLHGFSRGSANIYAVAALDRFSGDRYYGMILANAGGAAADFPPNIRISGGQYGYGVFGGTYWMMFCGGRDPNPERDGCPAMRRAEEWVGRYGGVVDLFIEDREAGHGGFHQTPAHMSAALDAFRRNQQLRRGAPTPATRWSVNPDPKFEIPGASIPNAGWVNGEVWLTVGTRNGMRLYRSIDGSSATDGKAIPNLVEAFADSGYGPGEVLPRQLSGGRRALFVLGLGPPGAGRDTLFRLVESADGRFVRDPAQPVFTAHPFIGVPDITPLTDGGWRVTYVARGARPENSRTAKSDGEGVSFASEFNNPFGDLAEPAPNANVINVDPAILKLASGGYLAVTMRAMRLYLFTSIDGRTFSPAPGPPIEAKELAPGANGLFDPTLVQLPDGRIFMYVTAGDAQGTSSRVVRAEIKAVSGPGSQLPAPSIDTGGVRNAASGVEMISPGSIFSIHGSRLAPSTASAGQYPLPTELAGVRVTVQARAAPLFAVSPTRITAQAPYDILPGAAWVEAGTARAMVRVEPVAPGIFTDAEGYSGPPAAPLSVATVYLTGQGEVDPPLQAGAAAPAEPLVLLKHPVTVALGGIPATVLFAGLTPGYAGLAQLNFRVPDLAPGEYDLVATVGGVPSNSARFRVASVPTQ